MALLAVSVLFAAGALATVAWSTSMSAMGGMPMPGGWTMSMAWMRMPGQTWPGFAASFLGMHPSDRNDSHRTRVVRRSASTTIVPDG